MTTQVEIFDICLNNIEQNWRITKQGIDDNFQTTIKSNNENGTYKDGNNNGYIKINDYKDILGIDDNGDYTGDLKVLKNIVDIDLPNLKAKIDNVNNNLSINNNLSNTNTNIDIIDAYKKNKKFYIENKDKIHGAIIQAKTQNENYNNLISTSINLICGILIVSYLIYKIYSPITISEIQNAVKTTTDTAKNVAEQAQSSTSKIISGK